MGFSKHKDSQGCLKILKTFAYFIHVVEANNVKALSKFEIKKDLLKINFLKFQIEDNIKKALENAKNLAKGNELLLICGSFYILDEMSKNLNIKR